jgi:N-acyl-D-amino-acid deacylase
MRQCHVFIFFFFLLSVSCKQQEFDILISGGLVYDGFGEDPYIADIGISGDTIVSIGDLKNSKATRIIVANRKIVCPGFINVLSQAGEDLLKDGRGLSDLYQGVTTQIIGEGVSMAPLNDIMQKDWDYPYWKTFHEFLEYYGKQPITQNIGSLVGATTIRIYVLGYDSLQPNVQQLKQMEGLVSQAMEAGALGVSSALIYSPARYASTYELTAMAKVAQRYGGIYASHIRSEGNQLIEALDEFFLILRESGGRGEIHHLKVLGRNNWHNLDRVTQKIDSAIQSGLLVSANMYTYTAASTGLNACFPPWSKEGGNDKWLDRLQDHKLRKKIIAAISKDSRGWENFYMASGDPENILVTSFANKALNNLTGKNIKQISKAWNCSPEETIIELVLKNNGDVNAVYFLMDEKNIQQKVQLSYMTFGSDSHALSINAEQTPTKPHPRTYGNFSRLLEKYVGKLQLLSLEKAIKRLTLQPALNYGLEKRGALVEGWFADIIVLDKNNIKENATYLSPHQYSSGTEYVIINGEEVFNQEGHTGKYPGQVLRGPGHRN